MRSAKTIPGLRQPRQRNGPSWGRLSGWLSAEKTLHWEIGFGILFLAGYVVGILLSREQMPEFGTVLAKFYLDKQNYLSFTAAFVAAFSALFLQAGLILLCGTNAVGVLLLAVFFAGKGMLLGAEAMSVLQLSDARGLIIYWLLTALPNVTALILLLWMAVNAAILSASLFQVILNGAGSHSTLARNIRTLMLRYLITLCVGAVCSAFGAAAAKLFAEILL